MPAACRCCALLTGRATLAPPLPAPPPAQDPNKRKQQLAQEHGYGVGGGGGQGAMARHGAVRPLHPPGAVPGPVIWSKAEDDLLLAITHEFGVNWTMVRGRRGRACFPLFSASDAASCAWRPALTRWQCGLPVLGRGAGIGGAAGLVLPCGVWSGALQLFPVATGKPAATHVWLAPCFTLPRRSPRCSA